MDPVKYQIHTFGCKVNTYDSGLLQKMLAKHNFSESESPRVHVLNSCAVTAEATKEAVKLARRLKARDPFCTVVVTGCSAQVDTEAFENLPGADLVVANSHKTQLPDIIQKYFKGEIKDKVFKSNIFHKEDLEMGGGVETTHTRTFLKIQDGCNSFCTYCVIPFSRGKSRSISIKNLINRVNELYTQGVREVVLTGVHIGDYEDQALGQKLVLEDLVESLLRYTDMPRFRLSSLEPVELSDRLLRAYENPKMCPHFHMSIQSANSKVLKDMKRNYTQSDVYDALTRIKQALPEAFVGMDVIVGFPTETLEDFEDTYFALEQLPWTKIHVFPYSERPGTYAARLEASVPQHERALRSARLRELSLQRYTQVLQDQVGTEKNVLVLKKSSKNSQSISRDYWPVQLGIDQEKFGGQEVKVKIKAFQNLEHQREGYLVGELF